MNSSAAIYLGNTVIRWSPLIITLGILTALAMTLALYKPNNRSTAAVWAFFPIEFILAVVLCRLFHWYFNMEQYAKTFGESTLKTLINAFTDYSSGSFCMPGMIIAAIPAAGITAATGLVSDRGRMLDYAAPGLCITAAFIRLSAFFNQSCRGKRPIEAKLLQRLPVSVAVTDSAGNSTYRLAVFLIEFILLAGGLVVLLRFFAKRRTLQMYEPCRSTGNVWKIFLVLFSAVEIVTDSLRTDSPLMHFTILTKLNAYSAFISFAQVCAVIFLICTFAYYCRCSAASLGFRWQHGVAIGLFAASLAGVGYFGEYSIQRYGSVVSGYIIMIISLVVICLLIYMLYRSCAPEEEYYD